MDIDKKDGSGEKASKLFLLGVIVLLLLVAGAIGLKNYHKSKNITDETKNNPKFEVGKPYADPNPQQYASTGKVVAGFPNDLLAGSSDVTNSYSRTSGANSLLSAQFNVNKNEKEAYDFYTKYLNDHNYSITAKSYAEKAGTTTISSLYGKAANGDQLNIVIMQSKADPNVKPVTVSIVYNPHK